MNAYTIELKHDNNIPSSYETRKLGIGDVDKAMAILEQDYPDDIELKAGLIRSIANGQCFGASSCGSLVSIAACDCRFKGEIFVMTDKSWRREGYGNAALRAAMDHMHANRYAFAILLLEDPGALHFVKSISPASVGLALT